MLSAYGPIFLRMRVMFTSTVRAVTMTSSGHTALTMLKEKPADMIQALIVVPILAPMMIEIAWARVSSAAFTKDTVINIPAPVMKAAQEYCDWEIDDILLFEQADGAPAYYQIEYDRENSDREKQLLLFPDGSIFTRL